MITITGHKIHLRDMQLGDLDSYRHWQQPDHEWQKLDGPYYPKPTSDQTENILLKIEGRIANNSWPEPRTRLIIADKATNQLRGMVTRYWISKETNWAAVGIVIYDPAVWRQGIGYEALGQWTDYLFSQFPGWVRLDLRTWSGNHGMVALAQKLGYQEEARFRQARIVDGQYYDGLGFGILRTEWAAQFPNGFVTTLPDTA